MDRNVSSPLLENGGLFVGERSKIAPLPWTHNKMVGYVRDADGNHLINCARATLTRASGMEEFGDRVVTAVNAHDALVAALREIIGDTEFGCDRPSYLKARAALKLAEAQP